MPGLSKSELAIVVFILLLVVGAGRLPRWGEALGSYLYRRRNAGHPLVDAPAPAEPGGPNGSSAPAETRSSSQAPLP